MRPEGPVDGMNPERTLVWASPKTQGSLRLLRGKADSWGVGAGRNPEGVNYSNRIKLAKGHQMDFGDGKKESWRRQCSEGRKDVVIVNNGTHVFSIYHVRCFHPTHTC